MTVNKNELKLVLEKLDTVKLRLRTMFLPEEEATEEEKKEVEAAQKETAKGSKTKLKEFLREIDC